MRRLVSLPTLFSKIKREAKKKKKKKRSNSYKCKYVNKEKKIGIRVRSSFFVSFPFTLVGLPTRVSYGKRPGELAVLLLVVVVVFKMRMPCCCCCLFLETENA